MPVIALGVIGMGGAVYLGMMTTKDILCKFRRPDVPQQMDHHTFRVLGLEDGSECRLTVEDTVTGLKWICLKSDLKGIDSAHGRRLGRLGVG